MGRPSGDSGAVGRSRRQPRFFWAAPLPPPTPNHPRPPPPPHAPPPAGPDAVAPDAQALARLRGALPSSAPGAAAPVAAPPGRFALIGVLSGRRSGGGAALIAVDGKPARPFRIGAAVDQ